MEKTIVVIGNGPSLRGFDLTTLSHVDTLGMNAAYRFWDRINWYPTHYCCLDPELIVTHHQEIRRLVQTGRVKTAFLEGRFLEFFPEAASDNRYVFLDQFSRSRLEKLDASLGLSFIESSIFRSSQPSKVTTGSYAVRYLIHLGYQRIALIGIDLQYVERIPEAENTGGIQLVIKETPSHNPNYFFDDYQRAGDRFQVPNPQVHNFDLHPVSFEALRDDVVWQKLSVEIVNCNLKSELHARGIFPYVPLWKMVGATGLGALVVPTQVKERDRILNNLRLWQKPAFAPFLHLRGRTKPKLIFTFTGEENEALKQDIVHEFETSQTLQRFFSDVQFYFFLLPEGEDVYIRTLTADTPPVGKKGYKSGPNQQFFRSLFALHSVCRYAFFMETDCLPLRPDWLGSLYDRIQTAEEFWVLGSVYKGKTEILRRSARHINGNAVYAVGDEQFIDFAKQWQLILDHVTEHIDKGIAYDCALEYFFSSEFGPDPNAPWSFIDPLADGWQLFQAASPYLRYTDYMLNYSGKEDLKNENSSDLLRQIRQAHRESYIVHNRQLCDDICAQVLVKELEGAAKTEEFARVLDVLSNESVAESGFTGVLFRGAAYPTRYGFAVGGGATENFVALQYAHPIQAGDRIQAIVELSVAQACTLALALYGNGQSPAEGSRQTFICKGGTERFTLQANFSQSHAGIQLQLGSDDSVEVECLPMNVSLQRLA
jgi:hypothetical protein